MIDFSHPVAEGGDGGHTGPLGPEPGPRPDPLENPEGVRASRDEIERLGDEIAELAAQIHAATYRLLVLIRRFDRRFEEWAGGSGFKSTAHWLSWRTSLGIGAARERVRVARALGKLPRISEAMSRGELSYSKVRAVTRVARPDTEERLLELARHATASELERVVRAWRRVDRTEELEEDRLRTDRRSLSLHRGADGMYEIRGRLPAEVGAVLARALEAGADALWRARRPDDEATAPADRPTAAQRRADAIGLVAECALRSGLAADDATRDAADHAADHGREPKTVDDGAVVGRADRFQVVVHVDAEALREDADDGQSVLDGIRVPAETSRRLACDSGRVVMLHDADGNVLDVGRRTRTVPAAIRRALEHRDRGCRFPGCGSRFCDAHHVRHWADGGETRLGNLVLLCRRHHRAVHEDGFEVELMPRGEARFTRPDGRPLPRAPRPPTIGTDPIGDIRRANGERASEIDGWTAAPKAGPLERLDLDRTIYTMWRPPPRGAHDDESGVREPPPDAPDARSHQEPPSDPTDARSDG